MRRIFPILSSLVISAFMLAAVTSAQDIVDRITALHGTTMGTTYMVKIFDASDLLRDNIAVDIDAELRAVNDQMSTYLKSSEVSRFNASDSTDWFGVSDETALVVDYAMEVSEKTNGAFDITVGPLVNLWSFGPEPRSRALPSETEISARLQQVGYQNIEVRRDPAAIRKSIPNLQIDLSAIAKGHGVDRIVELLRQRGAENVFVEIGGEVRVTGDKAGEPWMVGIQQPDSESNALLVRYPIADSAMATSGDYRNRFQVDGKYYSHTIDPRTGRPITHGLASVTVLAENCMQADAWATAIDVLGPEQGLAAAQANGLDVLLATRRGETFELSATGKLRSVKKASEVRSRTSEVNKTKAGKVSNLIPILVITLIAFAVVLAAMAVGVMFGRRPISGSCGGLAGTTNDDGTTRCALCSNPVDGCKELRERMSAGQKNE